VHLHQLALQAEELLEIAVARLAGGVVLDGRAGLVGIDVLPVLALHLELLVVVVDQFPVDALDDWAGSGLNPMRT
jgi:hypothetical protein